VVDFDAAQWVVEIAASDVAFLTRPACGTWFSTRRHPAQASIGPGVWVVGEQISPGLYTAQASPGCYWERLRHFNGQPEGVIDGNLIGSSGAVFVTVDASDAGFRSNTACGTWMRASTAAAR